MGTRPSFDILFMGFASDMAKRSTCPRGQVGAVITRGNQILASGYNGSPRGLPHCTDIGCLQSPCAYCQGKGSYAGFLVPEVMCTVCNGSGVYGSCRRTIHAEANAIIQCARNGVTTEDSTIYITSSPCIACAGLIIASGITDIMYKTNYTTNGLSNEISNMLEQAGVLMWKVSAGVEDLDPSKPGNYTPDPS